MLKIQIKSMFTGAIIFEYEKEDNTRRDTVIEAVKKKINLSNADLDAIELIDVDLTNAILRGADLAHVVLRDAILCGANLTNAILHGTDLGGAKLSGTTLDGVNLRHANLSSTNLHHANLEAIRKDFFDILLRVIPEVNNLKTALLAGEIDGLTDEGECADLWGTLEKSKSRRIRHVAYDERGVLRLITRFFLGIKAGDTPETNQLAKIVIQWIEELERLINYKYEENLNK